ncbi:MAG: alpha-mannosidase [Spirochaetes bacterium]|nr:alpha-mannosidase [Spirochaetota bacterium]
MCSAMNSADHKRINEKLTMLSLIKKDIYLIVDTIETEAWVTEEPVPFKNRMDGKHIFPHIGKPWGKLFDCAWFRFRGKVPDIRKGYLPVLLIDIGGEVLLTDEKGNPLRGLTTGSSIFSRKLGEPLKNVFILPGMPYKRFEYWGDAGNNDLFGNLPDGGKVRQIYTALCNQRVLSRYYDAETASDYVFFFPDHEHENSNKGGNSSLRRSRQLTIYAIGHAHLDLAWLWPVRESIRKGARSFATALYLLDHYPEYIYSASQPQLYQWIKENYPQLYLRITERVTEHRIEPLGAMWVEPDTNIPSGESLVRQIIHGKRFFKEEFSIDSDILWLPDSFGFSAALPQILLKSRIKYFATQKLSWNSVNRFPYHSFNWEGIDGSTVIAHMLPEETYNSPATVESVYTIQKNYTEKAVSHHCLMVYGIGDGGGGPGIEHLERLNRIKKLKTLPEVKFSRVSEFFSKLAGEAEKLPRWKGELYLEKHQGTFTTHGEIKEWNDKLEKKLRETEMTAAFAGFLTKYDKGKHQPARMQYGKKQLDDIWKKILLYQFHDILPGSAIRRVYEECIQDYQRLYDELGNLLKKETMCIAERIRHNISGKTALVFNYISHERTEWFSTRGSWFMVHLPQFGYSVIDLAKPLNTAFDVKAENELLENEILTVRLNRDGSIGSIFDREAGKEIVRTGFSANEFLIYKDNGDAWDYGDNYRNGEMYGFTLESTSAKTDGPLAIVKNSYRFRKSTMLQEVILTSGERRIDFKTSIQWHDPGFTVRVRFPVTVRSDYATCGIQFGSIQRPTQSKTSRERAKEEIPAQKWVDISNNNYGAALLTTCKYGYRVKESILELGILRSVPYPGAEDNINSATPLNYTDLKKHSFTYSFYPHTGNHVEAEVAQHAIRLNNPPAIIDYSAAGDSENKVLSNKGQHLPPSLSFLRINNTSIIVETVKPAEEKDGIVVRLYESSGSAQRAVVTCTLPVTSVFETNLLEEKETELAPVRINRGTDIFSITLSFKPFEIKTLLLL